MKNLTQYIAEFLVKKHTSHKDYSGYGKFAETNGKELKLKKHLAINKDGEEMEWFKIWQYLQNKKSDYLSNIEKTLGYQKKDLQKYEVYLKVNNMIDYVGNRIKGLPIEDWKEAKTELEF